MKHEVAAATPSGDRDPRYRVTVFCRCGYSSSHEQGENSIRWHIKRENAAEAEARRDVERTSLGRSPGCTRGCDSDHYANCNCSDGLGRCDVCHVVREQ